MKEIERLANDFVDLNIYFSEDSGVRAASLEAFEAGFRKAREMAVEKLAKNELPNFGIDKIGEKEVK